MARSTVDSKAVETELERILASREFHASSRMCRFLRFIVEATLAGKAEELKEYSIAEAVFERGVDFDPRTDPVVRSEARRLRNKITAYYATDGLQNELVIELPKGGYIPVFHKRTLMVEDTQVERAGSRQTVGELEVPLKFGGFNRAYIAAALGPALILFVTGFLLIRAHSNRPNPQAVRSVAVLPFQNMTGDGRIEYLADGIADEVLNSLAYVPDLKVVARTSAAQFKGRTVDIKEIGQRLGVKLLLEGSVRSSDDKLRVLTRLVNADTGYQLWSHSYEFQTKDVFTVQDAIAKAVLQQLGPGVNKPFRRLTVDGEEAYNDYLLSRHYIAETPGDGAALHEAKRLLEKAVALDPRNADAWATLSGVYGISAMNGAVPLAEGLQMALQNGEKALALDPDSADALANKAAGVAILHHAWSESDQLFRRAVTIKPSDALNHFEYGEVVLWSTSRLEEAQREMEKAIELDPLNAELQVGLCVTLYFRHQYDRSVQAGQQALAMSPNVQHIADNLLRPLVVLRRVDEISGLIQRFWKNEPDRSFALSMLELARRNQAEASKHAKKALEQDHDIIHRALLYAVLNEENNIISTFAHATFRENMLALDGAVLDPAFDTYRSSPQFLALMKQVVSAR